MIAIAQVICFVALICLAMLGALDVDRRLSSSCGDEPMVLVGANP